VTRKLVVFLVAGGLVFPGSYGTGDTKVQLRLDIIGKLENTAGDGGGVYVFKKQPVYVRIGLISTEHYEYTVKRDLVKGEIETYELMKKEGREFTRREREKIRAVRETLEALEKNPPPPIVVRAGKSPWCKAIRLNVRRCRGEDPEPEKPRLVFLRRKKGHELKGNTIALSSDRYRVDHTWIVSFEKMPCGLYELAAEIELAAVSGTEDCGTLRSNPLMVEVKEAKTDEDKKLLHYTRAYYFFTETGEFQKGERELTRILEMFPAEYNVYGYMGQMLFEKGDEEGAYKFLSKWMAWYEKQKVKDPRHMPYVGLYLELKEKLGKPRKK